MNKFTLIIHNKGWSVKDACTHWNIHYDTYNARCNNPKMFNQLECMCNGLKETKEVFMKWHIEQHKKAIEISCGVYNEDTT